MSLDAIIISNFGTESLSGSSPQRLSLNGRVADIQTILNYIRNTGKIVDPVVGSDRENWAGAPTLNGLILTNFLTSKGFSVELINDFYREKDKFINAVHRNPKLIALSTSFIYSKDHLTSVVRDIRQYASDSFIVAGGSFVYKSYLIHKRSNEPLYSSKEMQQSYLFFEDKDSNRPSIDLYIVSHYGENILCKLLEILRNGQSPKSIPNTAWYESSSIRFTNRVDEKVSIEDCGLNLDEFDDSLFSSNVMPLQASNGCPYHCAFCNFTSDRRFVFSKSIDQIISELKAVARRGVRYVWFVDDNFMLGSGDLNKNLDRLANENLGIKWMNFIRADALKNIDYQLLRNAGCVEVRLGLESADPGILQNMQKRADPDTYRIVVENLLKVGINCSCYFIFGFPGETLETAQRTRDFIKSIEYPELEGIMQWSLYPFMLAPLSPIFEEDQRNRYNLTGALTHWSHATMNSEQAQQEVIKTILTTERSGAIYRSDNMLLLDAMTSKQKKAFFNLRNILSKKSMAGELCSTEIVQAFCEVIPSGMLNV
jgi:anaerobic magnesium-protoporphyrin IX monomethyl ester cyclase